MCIGAHLARMETKLAFEALFERFPNMELLDKKPKWGRNFIFRGFEHLEIKAN
jgi:cytochrome P450